MKKMIKANNLLNLGKQILKDAGIESYAFDASLLFEHCFDIKREDLFLYPDTEVEEDVFLDLCKKRAGGYPLQYILGSWQFMGIDFYVNENVLIPRADTETVVEYILGLGGAPKILDICTGTGCIGIALGYYLKNADITLADISEKALDTATKNADRNGVAVKTVKADLFEGSKKYFEDGKFDIIVANPPYIKTGDMCTLSKEVMHEPALALFSGKAGTDHYKALIHQWKDALKPGGKMVLESGYDTYVDIQRLFEDCGYRDIVTLDDAGGNVRLVSATKAQ